MAPPASRLHHLDAARALLLLLGLPFHVATKAIYETQAGAVDFQQSLLISGWVSFTHTFRMFAFFLIAGYFAGMIRTRKGTRAWMVERARRLGLPFLASLFTLGALQFQLQEVWLHKPSSGFLGLPFALDHLWFLLVLLAYCALYAMVPTRRIMPGERVRKAMLLAGPQSLALMVLLAAWGLGRHLVELIPQSPDAATEVTLWHHFLLHSPAFVLGVVAWHAGIADRFFALSSRWMVTGIVILLALYLPFDPMLRPALGLEIFPDLAGALSLRASELPLAFLLSLALFRLLSLIVRGPSRIVALFVDGALAIYLFHLIWAMILLPFVRAMPIPSEMQWMLASAAVLLLALASYLVMRASSLTAMLFCGVAPRPAHPSEPAISHPAR